MSPALDSRVLVDLRERIDEGNPEGFEIIDIASYHAQTLHQSGSGDEGIFQMMIGPGVHELGPAPENRGVHRKDIVGLGDAIPMFSMDYPYRLVSSLVSSERPVNRATFE
jgi:hypothetical protein